MPSWDLHRRWGKRICNFYSEEIDALIDDLQKHDAGRYDKEIFLEQIKYVSSKYGVKGVEYYLLHHLLDMLKDGLVSMASRHGRIDLEEVKRILEWLKPKPLREYGEYEAVWNNLILKLRSEMTEVVKDIVSEEGFKRSLKRADINKRVPALVRLILEYMPPCISIGSADRVLINSRVLKAVWAYISSNKDDKDIDEKAVITEIKRTIADYIRENNLYKKELCSRNCRPREVNEETWKQFIKSLNIPCPFWTEQ